jgi:hypothetical protein
LRHKVDFVVCPNKVQATTMDRMFDGNDEECNYEDSNNDDDNDSKGNDDDKGNGDVCNKQHNT